MSTFVKYISGLNLLEHPWFIAGIVIVILLWSAIGVTAIAISSAKRPGLKKTTLFTTIREGTAKAIMRGEEFDGMISSWTGHHQNNPKAPWFNPNRPAWEVLRNSNENVPDANPYWNKDEWYNSKSFLERWFGIYWVGIPFQKSLYVYKFEWTEEKQGEGGTYVPRPRSELTDFIYIMDFSYHIVLKDAETRDNLPVNMHYLLTLRINNPRKAFFDTDDWLKRITGLTNSEARNHVGSLSFEELVSEKHRHEVKQKMESLITAILSLNTKLPASEDPAVRQAQSNGSEESAPSRYGVTIVSAEVQSIDPSSEMGKKAKEALNAVYVGEREGEVTKIKAAAQKQADITESEGKAQADINLAVGKAVSYRLISDSPDGLKLRSVEAFETVGKVGQNTTILTDGNIPAMFSIDKKEKK